MLEKELLEKCNQIGELDTRVTGTSNGVEWRIETQAQCEHYHQLAANALSLEEQLKQQEETHNQRLTEMEEKVRSVENRCIELLQIKIGQEKDISRLREENTQLVANEEYYKQQYDEMKKQSSLAIRRSDLTIQQVHEDCQLAIETENKRCNRVKEDLAEEIESLQKRLESECQSFETIKSQLQATIAQKTATEAELIDTHKKEMATKEEELKSMYEKKILTLQTEQETTLQSLKAEWISSTEEKCRAVREEEQKKAEEERSVLEMKMVKAKEKALADQTAVYKAEMAKEAEKCEERVKAMSSHFEQDSAGIQKVFEKESEEYRRVIADLRNSVDTKDSELKELKLQLKENQVAHEKTEELTRVADDLRASIQAKDTEMRQQASVIEEMKKTAEHNEEELKTLRKAVSLMNSGEEVNAKVLEVAKEEEKREEEMKTKIEALEKQLEEARSEKKKVEEDLEHERQERKDESKRRD